MSAAGSVAESARLVFDRPWVPGRLLHRKAARGFLLLATARAGLAMAEAPRLPRAGKRLFVAVPREGGAVDSYIIERRPGEGAALYSIVPVRNVAIDASLPA